MEEELIIVVGANPEKGDMFLFSFSNVRVAMATKDSFLLIMNRAVILDWLRCLIRCNLFFKIN